MGLRERCAIAAAPCSIFRFLLAGATQQRCALGFSGSLAPNACFCICMEASGVQGFALRRGVCFSGSLASKGSLRGGCLLVGSGYDAWTTGPSQPWQFVAKVVLRATALHETDLSSKLRSRCGAVPFFDVCVGGRAGVRFAWCACMC